MKLEELEKELSKIIIPESLYIKKDLNIIDCKKFIDSHLTVLKANSGNKRFYPHYNRLLLFYQTLKKY